MNRVRQLVFVAATAYGLWWLYSWVDNNPGPTAMRFHRIRHLGYSDEQEVVAHLRPWLVAQYGESNADKYCQELVEVAREGGRAAYGRRFGEIIESELKSAIQGSSNSPAEDKPVPQARLGQSEDDLMFQAARQCQSDEDLKQPECVKALNAYRMKAAQRILAEREARGPVPALMRNGSSSYFPPPQPPPRDQVYYLQDGTRVQESPGGMRQITPPNQSALPTRK